MGECIICAPCRACAECMRATVVPIVFLAWLNFLWCGVGAFSPYWVTSVNNTRKLADGPLVKCVGAGENGSWNDFDCDLREIPDQDSDLLIGASYCIMFAFIALMVAVVCSSIMKCKCFEASRVCFVGVIIVCTIVAGILCLTTIILYSIKYGDAFNSSEEEGVYDWGYYFILFEILLAGATICVDLLFCACCGACWTAQGAMCCCC